MAGPAICAKRANPSPNSNESTVPVTTPIPKPIAKILSQNRQIWRYVGSWFSARALRSLLRRKQARLTLSENNVKAHRKGKLNSGENGRIEFHSSAPSVGNTRQTTTAPSTNTASPAIANGKPNTPTMMKKKSTPSLGVLLSHRRLGATRYLS
jgi:hypothetical protein